MTFPRVIVMEAGRIAEDGDPSDLARRDGPFQRLLAAEAAIDGLWGTFTSLHVDRGRIAATGARPAEGGTA
jgi:hypothetical protein